MRAVRNQQHQSPAVPRGFGSPLSASSSSPLALGITASGSPSSVAFASPTFVSKSPGVQQPIEAIAAPQLELPISAMDVEVFERFIMRVLTSLHRLVAKMHTEIAEGSSNSNSSSTMLSPGGLETTSAAYAWTLVRRVTKRIEKLSIMEPVLEQKRAFLLARTVELEHRAAASAVATAANNGSTTVSAAAAAAAASQILHFGGQDATHYQRVQSELLLVEALMTKVRSSVDTFRGVETSMMAQLFRR